MHLIGKRKGPGGNKLFSGTLKSKEESVDGIDLLGPPAMFLFVAVK